MSATKNRQTEETLRRLIAQAFPDKTPVEMRELTEGYCNVTYRIVFADGSTTILKVAPEKVENTLRNERDMMHVEVNSMQLMQQYPQVKAPEVYYCDDTKAQCSGMFFFMETLEGENFASVAGSLPQEVRDGIHMQIGRTVRALADIRGEHFGILGQEQFDTQYDFFRRLMVNMLDDAAAVQLDLRFDPAAVLAMLEEDKPLFDEITAPSLLHWDLWEGNIFVKDGAISGLIDWERTMWGDPMMCDRFRRHSFTPLFLCGYGLDELSPAQKRRNAWYDLFLYATMKTEAIYREYEGDGQDVWLEPYYAATLAELGL